MNRHLFNFRNEVKDSIGSIGQKGEIEDREKENDFNSHDGIFMNLRGIYSFKSKTIIPCNEMRLFNLFQMTVYEIRV